MNKMWTFAAIPALCAALTPAVAGAQSFDVIGARAAGMGGAFVGVADDASAVYWNPAGLAAGAYFSLTLDGGVRRAVPDEGRRAGKQSSFLVAATMPALGLSYYRLRSAVSSPDPLLTGGDADPLITGDSLARVDTLVSHHAGITLVQSLTDRLAVGSTLKLVRGVASSHIGSLDNASEALDAPETPGRGTTRVDLDLGLMAAGGRTKVGFTVRNVREPEFTSPDGRVLKLERQARAGISHVVVGTIVVAADFDLLAVDDAFGERRDAAFGLEGRLARRAWVRTGFRLNTASDDEDGASERRAVTAGGTFAVTASVMVDAVVISGGDQAGRGWGVSARFVY